jgi:hypothetical protein
MKDSYKVIVWGPGHIGAAALKQALLRPEFDVVGVKVYSEHSTASTSVNWSDCHRSESRPPQIVTLYSRWTRTASSSRLAHSIRSPTIKMRSTS